MNSNTRFQSIDILRGSAVVLMIIYHFCYDLTYYRILLFDFYDGLFWLTFRIFIVSMFLGVVGISLKLATQNGIRWQGFLRRLGLLVFFAALISLMSYYMFPGRTIFFGILHFIAVASILGLLFIKLFWLNLFLGMTCIITGIGFSSSLFNQPYLQWVGLMTARPLTEDYVPLIPWFGAVLTGMFVAGLVTRCSGIRRIASISYTSFPARLLEKTGRYSLLIYMTHQPVMLAILYPLAPDIS